MGHVSVALCTYNGEKYLNEQLDSIAAQTRLPDDLVICDDCSSDSTAEVVTAFGRRAPFPVHFYVNRSTLGVAKNFERAIELCQGDIIALSDQDDIWCPNKLEKMVPILTEGLRPADLVFCDAAVVDDELRLSGYTLWPTKSFSPHQQRSVSGGRAWRVLLKHNVVSGNTMAFRAQFRELILPISPLGLHDSWIALLIACVGRVDLIDESLVLYRQHSANQVGASERNLTEMFTAATRPAGSIYADAAVWVEDALARLTERYNGRVPAPVLHGLRGRADFLRARAQLPRHRWRRMARALTGLLSLDYHRYANGVRSFASDLMRQE